MKTFFIAIDKSMKLNTRRTEQNKAICKSELIDASGDFIIFIYQHTFAQN